MITEGNLIADNSIESSEVIRRHFQNMDKARILYRQADCNRRIKDALKSRVAPSLERMYEIGEEIIFLDKNDQ